jgi:transcriptional regulator with XRE-family HTH domain
MKLLELGKKIVAWRKEQGINQAKLCDQTGISRVTLSKLENGELLELGYTKVERILSSLGKTLTPTNKAPAPTLDDLLRNRDEEMRNERKPGSGR